MCVCIQGWGGCGSVGVEGGIGGMLREKSQKEQKLCSVNLTY